jgi:hypothetical protein
LGEVAVEGEERQFRGIGVSHGCQFQGGGNPSPLGASYWVESTSACSTVPRAWRETWRNG